MAAGKPALAGDLPGDQARSGIASGIFARLGSSVRMATGIPRPMRMPAGMATTRMPA
jgi:hypothetical protein